jgi:CheY-like chemotaxis protein
MVSQGTIFYVDDNPRARRLLGSILKSCGFEIISEGDPSHALTRSKTISFDLLLLDYQMPRLSGSVLAQSFKNLKPDVPIVLISGLSCLPPAELVFVDAHIGRGSTLDELIESIKMLIRFGPQTPATPARLPLIPDTCQAA